LQEPGDSAAARDVELEAVDAAGLEEVERVTEDVDVLARRDLEPARPAFADEPQALEVGRAHRLLEPAHVPLGAVSLRPGERLLAAERAVRVDVQPGLRADCL